MMTHGRESSCVTSSSSDEGNSSLQRARFLPLPSFQQLGMWGSPEAQPPSDPVETRTKKGRPENDEDPGVHYGVHGEKTEGCQIRLLIKIWGKGSDISPDLQEGRDRKKDPLTSHKSVPVERKVLQRSDFPGNV